ncbi:hypothetical protein OY671_010226, partial [Metschnikowia pulcherrima]
FCRRARARQRDFFRDQDSGACRHRRHRLDAVCAVHGRICRQPADHRQRHGARARSTVAAWPRHLRSGYCQRHRVRRTATRCRRRGRYRPRRRR